jgi:twitching motility protein PilI
MPRPLAISPVAVLARLESRARTVASELPQDAGTDVGTARYIGFRLADHALLTLMHDVLEILPYPDLSRVPGAKPWLRGISQIRGRLLSIVDASLFLGGAPTPVRRGTRILIVQHEELLAGIVVDEVFGMKHQLGQVTSFVPEGEAHWLAGAVRHGVELEGEHWGIFDIAALTSNPEFFKAAA